MKKILAMLVLVASNPAWSAELQLCTGEILAEDGSALVSTSAIGLKMNAQKLALDACEVKAADLGLDPLDCTMTCEEYVEPDFAL